MFSKKAPEREFGQATSQTAGKICIDRVYRLIRSEGGEKMLKSKIRVGDTVVAIKGNSYCKTGTEYEVKSIETRGCVIKEKGTGTDVCVDGIPASWLRPIITCRELHQRIAELEKEITRQRKRAEDWEHVVHECEYIIDAKGRAASGRSANLPNIICNLRFRHDELKNQVKELAQKERQIRRLAKQLASLQEKLAQALDPPAD